ncbi:hypothetical protein IWQ57_003628, partial [Coemansia nantahalensis]
RHPVGAAEWCKWHCECRQCCRRAVVPGARRAAVARGEERDHLAEAGAPPLPQRGRRPPAAPVPLPAASAPLANILHPRLLYAVRPLRLAGLCGPRAGHLHTGHLRIRLRPDDGAHV